MLSSYSLGILVSDLHEREYETGGYRPQQPDEDLHSTDTRLLTAFLYRYICIKCLNETVGLEGKQKDTIKAVSMLDAEDTVGKEVRKRSEEKKTGVLTTVRNSWNL